MPGDLSSGLPRLATSGRQIVTDAGQPIALRGLNRSGLEYAEPDALGFLESCGLSEPEISWIVREWRANVLRVPFNQDWALNGRGTFSPTEYLDAIDRVIFWASRAGAYTLLDLQWLDADVARGLNSDGTINRVPALPTAESLRVWSLLAGRYRSEPAVLFDIFNEPHDPLADDPTVLEGMAEDGTTFPLADRRVTMAVWQPWARQLVEAIRQVHADSLVFVSGVRWAYDLRGMPLTVTADGFHTFPNIVYSTHVYPWNGRGRHSWAKAFGRLSRSLPVFVAEWGGEPQHVAWGEELVRYLTQLEVGWTAWSWSDYPRLVVDAQAQRYEPTEFGELVRASLRLARTIPNS